ncbi:hypothetical protein AB0J80_00325 [Actinoplanes sp. NPDC049548]|uniref:hypothetical protein n=1 Tax=Actinoplanes sp. NPDC049548 TaxID=3155152 RepID=UPI0034495EFC
MTESTAAEPTPPGTPAEASPSPVPGQVAAAAPAEGSSAAAAVANATSNAPTNAVPNATTNAVPNATTNAPTNAVPNATRSAPTNAAADSRSTDITAGQGGVMTDEVGVVTGELTLRTEFSGGQVVVRAQYKDADEWYTVTGAKAALKDPADLDAVHTVAVGILNRPEG